MKIKTILVTGGAGFIGSNFILYVLNNFKEYSIINVDCLTYAGNLENLKAIENNERYLFKQINICDRELIEQIFEEFSISFVVNFAAESHVDRSILNSEIFIKTNVLGTECLLSAARKAWQKEDGSFKDGVKFLQVSTDEVYGSLGEDGFFEETSEIKPRSPYSASKASADLIVKAFSETYGLPINITRCSNNYGPFQYPEKLIPLAINKLMNNEKIPVYGDGLQVRDWLFVKDHCVAIKLVLEKGKIGEIYNVGGHNEKRNIDIVKLIIKFFNEHVDSKVNSSSIEFVEDRKGHDRRYAINPDKIKNELGFEVETKFEDGIVKTIEWYLNNKNWLENVIAKGNML